MNKLDFLFAKVFKGIYYRKSDLLDPIKIIFPFLNMEEYYFTSQYGTILDSCFSPRSATPKHQHQF